MKKFIKFTTVILLILAMAFAFASCKDDPKPTKTLVTAGYFESEQKPHGGEIYSTAIALHTNGTYYLNDFTVIKVGSYVIANDKICFDGLVSATYDIEYDETAKLWTIKQFACMGGSAVSGGWDEDLIQKPATTLTELAVAIATYYDSDARDGANIELMSDYTFIYMEKGFTETTGVFTGTWIKAVSASATTYTLTSTTPAKTFTLVVSTTIKLTYDSKTVNLQTKNPLDAPMAIWLAGTDSYAMGMTIDIKFYKDSNYEIIFAYQSSSSIIEFGKYEVSATTYAITLTPDGTDGTVASNTINLNVSYQYEVLAYNPGVEVAFGATFDLTMQEIPTPNVSMQFEGELWGTGSITIFLYEDNTFAVYGEHTAFGDDPLKFEEGTWSLSGSSLIMIFDSLNDGEPVYPEYDTDAAGFKFDYSNSTFGVNDAITVASVPVA